MKPFGSCGFELLRVLGLEFSLRTRTEAICLRSEVMKKDFRIDARGTHVVSDLLRAMAVETSRYDKLISTLPPTVPRTDLMLNESDQALILIRNLPADARQYVLLHAQDDGLTALREAGLKYERQQRLYSELGAVAGKLRQVQEGESGAESDDEGAVDAIGTGDKSKRCTKCGKRHETRKCRTDMTNITCSGKASQDGKPSSKGSGKGKKGKMFEVTFSVLVRYVLQGSSLFLFPFCTFGPHPYCIYCVLAFTNETLRRRRISDPKDLRSMTDIVHKLSIPLI